jgi:hypothetical protein
MKIFVWNQICWHTCAMMHHVYTHFAGTIDLVVQRKPVACTGTLDHFRLRLTFDLMEKENSISYNDVLVNNILFH